MNVEIVVQRNTRPAVALREIQDLGIFSPLQSNLTGVQRIPTCQRTMTIAGEMLTDGFEIYVSSIVTWDDSHGELITDADRQRILRNVRFSLESQGARVVLN